MKPAKNKKDDYFQVYGINGCYNIVNAKKLQILSIDLMQGGIAEKKTWVKDLLQNKKFPVKNFPKEKFLKNVMEIIVIMNCLQPHLMVLVKSVLQVLKQLKFYKTRNIDQDPIFFKAW